MEKKKAKKKRNRGFTLIEMIIVVAILAILVGVLAPQYTKYVEKSRKAADASNMNEIIKVIKMYAIDGTHQLKATKYQVSIGSGMGKGTSDGTVLNELDGINKGDHDEELRAELEKEFPHWETKLKTKSKKWGKNGKPAAISATIEIKPDGGMTVSYSPDKFAEYMNGNDK